MCKSKEREFQAIAKGKGRQIQRPELDVTRSRREAVWLLYCHTEGGSGNQARLDHPRLSKTTKESGVFSEYNNTSLESFKRDRARIR